jgi:hypothetical protein
MPARTPRATPADLARLYVLEATIEILRTENAILKRRLAAAETRAAQAVITKRLDAPAAVDFSSWRPAVVKKERSEARERMKAHRANVRPERSRPWWRRALAG